MFSVNYSCQIFLYIANIGSLLIIDFIGLFYHIDHIINLYALFCNVVLRLVYWLVGWLVGWI